MAFYNQRKINGLQKAKHRLAFSRLQMKAADSMGDYYNPYLGTTAFVQWNEEEFKKRKTSKQSISGYKRLYNDCETIKEALKSLFK